MQLEDFCQERRRHLGDAADPLSPHAPGYANHEPRGCSRGASYSWYLYSASRIKYPLVRSRLVKAWREARQTLAPVEAWAAILGNADTASSHKSVRGRGGFVRSSWNEVSEIIAADTIKTWGPDRIVGVSLMLNYLTEVRRVPVMGVRSGGLRTAPAD